VRAVADGYRRAVLAADDCGSGLAPVRHHLVVLGGEVGLGGDVVDAEVQELLARVAQEPARSLVDGEVTHALVGDENGVRRSVDSLPEQACLHQRFGDAHEPSDGRFP
jgi:hypothetical protein